jgi:hypothetical protein
MAVPRDAYLSRRGPLIILPRSSQERKYSPWERGHARSAIVLIEQLRVQSETPSFYQITQMLETESLTACKTPMTGSSGQVICVIVPRTNNPLNLSETSESISKHIGVLKGPRNIKTLARRVFTSSSLAGSGASRWPKLEYLLP